MKFDFDENKSNINRIKHGVDFVEARKIWDGPYIEADNIAYDFNELRHAIVGPIGEDLYTCLFTYRGKKIRLISCRRSRNKEREIYEKAIREK